MSRRYDPFLSYVKPLLRSLRRRDTPDGRLGTSGGPVRGEVPIPPDSYCRGNFYPLTFEVSNRREDPTDVTDSF